MFQQLDVSISTLFRAEDIRVLSSRALGISMTATPNRLTWYRSIRFSARERNAQLEQHIYGSSRRHCLRPPLTVELLRTGRLLSRFNSRHVAHPSSCFKHLLCQDRGTPKRIMTTRGSHSRCLIHVPSHFTPKMKWVPQDKRGKLVVFRSRLNTRPQLPQEGSRMTIRGRRRRSKSILAQLLWPLTRAA